MTTPLTNAQLNARILAKTVEIAAIAQRAQAMGRKPHREIGHLQTSVLRQLNRDVDLSAIELSARLGVKVYALVYTMAALKVRGAIELLPSGRWRFVPSQKGRAAA